MRLWTAEEIDARAERRSTAARHRRKPHQIPRCRCGCGKAAKWPQDGSPLFYSREHGYLMACRLFRPRKRQGRAEPC